MAALNLIKNRIRNIVGHPQLSRWMFKDTVSLFVYHDVSNETSPFCQTHALNVTPLQFAEQMKFIKDHFHMIDPDVLLKGDFATPAALVTFDDGMAGYFQNAVPIMEKMKIPSLLFLNMAPIEGKLFWSGLVTYLTAHDSNFVKFVQEKKGVQSNLPAFLLCSPQMVTDYVATHGTSDLEAKVRAYYGEFGTIRDLEQAAKNPFVFYGNHLYNHYNAACLAEDELREQYYQNQKSIDQFSCGRKLFAYPFGQPGSCFTARQTQILMDCGAEAVFFSGGGTNKVNKKQFVFDRVGVDPYVKTINDLNSRLQAGSLRAALRTFKKTL